MYKSPRLYKNTALMANIKPNIETRKQQYTSFYINLIFESFDARKPTHLYVIISFFSPIIAIHMKSRSKIDIYISGSILGGARQAKLFKDIK